LAETTAPRVQVIVVAFNSAATLQRCIDALEAQSFTDWEAVVWDNASADDAVERLRAGPRVHIVRHAANLGFAAGNNRAAERSTSELVVFLNPDAFPEPDWLARLVAAADTYGVEAIASLQLDDGDPEVLDGAGDCMSVTGIPWRGGYGQPRSTAPTEACEVFSACGAAALYRRDAFEALRGFEERFFCYCEDVDLGFRLRLMGGRCVLEPRAVVRHVGGASSGGEGSAFAEYHGARNRLWTFGRNMPLALMPLALPAHLLVTAYVLLRSPGLLSLRLKAIGAALSDPEGFRPPRGARRGRLMNVARSLSWSPLDLSRRGVVQSPIRR
jgi:N-acetylglucosaminyl-diphospho-decaprenol L-rhamnosyltransferase